MGQFKTYSVIWMMTHLERAIYGGGMGRAAYALSLPIFLTLGGYIADTLIDLSKGESLKWALRKCGSRARSYEVAVWVSWVISCPKVLQMIVGQPGRHAGLSGGTNAGGDRDPITALTLENLGDAAQGKTTHAGQ
jgi:hypothetical protein